MKAHVPSYWAATAGPEPDQLAPLPGGRTAEVAVLGGGYTGLAAAYRLAGDHGLDTVLLEARAIGWGASGRNGGFAMISLGKLSLQEREARWGLPVARRVLRLGVDACERVRELIAKDATGIPRFPLPFLRRVYLAGAYVVYGLKDRG